MPDTPAPPRMRTVEEVYGSAFAEEEAFEAALGQSLAPRGFDLSCRVARKSGYALTGVLPADPPVFPADGHLHTRYAAA
jgi:hypothetical protein